VNLSQPSSESTEGLPRETLSRHTTPRRTFEQNTFEQGTFKQGTFGQRTFKMRRSRMGATRQADFERLTPLHSIAAVGPPLDLALLGGGRPVVVDIGSGMGEATIAAAVADPITVILAVEVHTPGLANLLQGVERERLDNVFVCQGDALAFLNFRVAPESIDGVRIFFPDPWPKTRHHKRRLITPERVTVVISRLRVGGWLHFATDDSGYAEIVVAVMGEQSATTPTVPPQRPTTGFERRAMLAGRACYDLAWIKKF